MQFDWSAIWPAIPLLIEGAKMTLWISVLGLAGGLVIGLLAGFARTFGGWIANHVALVFIEVIRGTPIVVQVMFIYFALPMAFNDLRIDPFTAAVVTIMINSGAYIAEITRGAVLSIHKGFREAGLALGREVEDARFLEPVEREMADVVVAVEAGHKVDAAALLHESQGRDDPVLRFIAEVHVVDLQLRLAVERFAHGVEDSRPDDGWEHRDALRNEGDLAEPLRGAG